jgi:hypothetical protein
MMSYVFCSSYSSTAKYKQIMLVKFSYHIIHKELRTMEDVR